MEDNKEYSILTALYETGTGVDRDVEKSKRYYAMSCANALKIEKIKSGVVPLSAGECNYDENETISLFRNKYYLRRLEREGAPHAAIALADIMSSSFYSGTTMNTYQNYLDHNLDKDRLYVAECYVSQGPILKRIRPRAQGRAYRILKRMCHINVVLDERS